MALHEEGVPIKIVYLGHRDGTAMVVHKDSNIFRIEDLKGKTVRQPPEARLGKQEPGRK
jgi:NitT/TauT family transport system substrate-binding protein